MSRLNRLVYSFAAALISACSINANAACPGFTSFVPIKQIVVTHTGGTQVQSYVQLDTTSGASADPCSCKVSGSSHYYITRLETNFTEGHKMLIGLATAAKAMDKKLLVYVTQCLTGSPGYALYSQINTEP